MIVGLIVFVAVYGLGIFIGLPIAIRKGTEAGIREAKALRDSAKASARSQNLKVKT